MGEIHLYIYRIYPVPTQGSICASVRDDQTSWTPKPDTFLVENHNSHRYDLSPPATTEHLRNATWDLKYPTMFMIFTLNLKFLHRRDFFPTNTATHISHEFVWYQFCSCSAIGNIYISEKQKRVCKKASCSKQSLQTATGVVGHLSKLFIKNSTANSLWHVVQQCLTLNSLHLST